MMRGVPGSPPCFLHPLCRYIFLRVYFIQSRFPVCFQPIFYSKGLLFHYGLAAVKELILLKKETENMKKAATEAKKTSQNEKKRIEQAAHAKKAEVDAELLSAKKLLKELTASRDHLREGVAPLLSTIKKLREQNNQNRTELAEMDSLFTADVQSLDEVMKTHTLSKGNEALLKEHEQEITSMQQDQRRVEREVCYCLNYTFAAVFWCVFQGMNMAEPESTLLSAKLHMHYLHITYGSIITVIGSSSGS